MDDITEEYRTSLADLTQNSKPLINMLTMLAEDNETHAAKIVEVIETHLQQVESTKKLPTLYLIDSIIKNLPKSTYPGLFSHNIVGIFCNMFEQVDEKTRQCMFKVRQTWNQHFTGRKMYALDVRVNNIDHAWPLSTPTSNISPIIHVNPKFLQQQREESLPLPDLPPIEDDEAEMRRLLIAKQAELLKLQQKRLELELKETETRLAQQKKTSEDLFVGVEPETASQPGGEATALNTQLTASQTVPRDPRLRDNRDPRMTSRDPRVCRDPRMRNKPVTAELLPNSNEVQPGLTFFGPVTNQPLNQFGQQPSEPALHEHLEPPQITPTMLPQPMNTMVPPQLQAPPPILTEGGNLNTNATPPIKLEMQELKHIHSPKKEMRRNPLIEVKKEISPVKIKVEKEEVDTNIKVKSEKFGSVSPKDKKRSDSRKSASDFRSKESKEHEIIESKASSSRNSRTRTRSSNSDSKSGSESKEGTKSKNKEDHDKGKSQIEEEKDRSKTQNVDNQRGKGKRTPVDHDSRKRNGAGDDRDKGKNWSDSRNRRSKSPRLSHERSRSPVKDSGRGSKNPPRKNKAKNELKNNNKKQMEEQQKLEHRKPISSLPRIPKRTGTDVDERVTEKDHDERRLSSSNKRDLDERHDYKEHEPVRTSKKPRISQERDVPTIEPVTVHTKMNEDISNLFGNEDQDYRHSDAVSPRGGGWARYKADHPKDFDNRRSSLEDIDHRIERQPRDTDYRPAPYYRPPVKSPGYNEGGRSGPQPSDPDVPSELRLENRENILRTMEMRRKSGEISHDDMQTVLRSLSEFDSIQEQRRHQPLRQDPPHLEPEISSQRDDRYRINRPPNEPMMDYHSRRNDPSEPPMEFQSPIKEPRNLPHDADMRRDDRPPVFDDLRREDELPRDTPLDRNRDFDRRNRTRAAERPKEDVHTYKESDRPSHRGTDRPKDDRFLLRGQDRPPHVRGRDFDEPGRPSLLGPGPRIRPEQDTVQNRAPMMNYDIDHRKPPHLERGPPLTDRRPPEIEAVRSPADKPVDERPSLLGPGPANLREKEVPEKKSESLLSKIEPISKLSEKHDAVVKPIAKKIENSALSVGAMLESLRSEHTPENSQDVPDKISKVDVKPKKEETPITKNPPKPAVEDAPVPKLVPKPVYDHNKDDRWIMPGGGRMMDGPLSIFPEGTEEIVMNGQPFPIKLGGPKCMIVYKGEKLEVFIDSTRRMLHINGNIVYKVSDPVKEVSWGPGPNNIAQIFYHGNPRNLWIDGFLYTLRIDAPPKIIKFRDKDYTILIDGRDGMILINKKEVGSYGGKPRIEKIDGERVELRFTPPPKSIGIDGEQCLIRLDRKIPFIIMKDVARGIRFDGPPREVIINNQKYFIPTDRAVECRVDNIFHMVAFGGPSHEIIIDGVWYELLFIGPPREITAGNHKLLVGLPTSPPDVKILDPIENQKLKDSDIDIKSSDRDRKGRSKRGHSGRSSPPLGQSGSQKTPVSILDLNVPKPPGLKKDMNNDRRRGSPLNEERPRSPVRHRDRRRRSPHRERRSPDRRGRRSILKDDRGHGSPINDQSNFNGPRNMPPFGPGQQGPNPQFNPVGPNQPFPQRPNQPFPPNQQFPGPNQPPFQQGPNQRFPSGPNQMPFPVGPNQPFQPGPNQQFPPGPNQQFPQGPNQQMQQFPPGPRPPMQQDEGSQGPHPMFIPGPNQQFPPGSNVQGQPMQTIPPMQNMPVLSQPMPIMSRPPMPVLNQPIPAMSQSMPIPEQSMPGQTIPFIPPVSMMNQPLMAGNPNQPQDGMPGLMPPQPPRNPNQPQDGMPGLMPPQPPTLQPQLNVESLLQKLIKAGLINANIDEAKEKSKENKEPVQKDLQKKKEEDNSEEGKEKRKPVRIKPSKVEKVPDLTEMKSNKLKQQYIGVIQRMYSGIQCTSCGTRFMASQTKLYREHLDWHFRQNQREKKGAKISRYRSWFYELKDWLDYEDVGDAEERAHLSLFELKMQESAEKEPILPQGENIIHCPAASGEDTTDSCVVCGDDFEQFFDEESEEWHLKNALRSGGKTYHPVCYEDAQESTVNTPKVDPGADPMLLQIQKELGYVPADTVVSFPAANVISVSQHDHTPKEPISDPPTLEAEGQSDNKQEAAAS